MVPDKRPEHCQRGSILKCLNRCVSYLHVLCAFALWALAVGDLSTLRLPPIRRNNKKEGAPYICKPK
jgi:hypothetical protein